MPKTLLVDPPVCPAPPTQLPLSKPSLSFSKQEIHAAVRSFGDVLNGIINKSVVLDPGPNCTVLTYGKSWGVHELCEIHNDVLFLF